MNLNIDSYIYIKIHYLLLFKELKKLLGTGLMVKSNYLHEVRKFLLNN